VKEEEYIYVKKKVRQLTRFDLDNYSDGQMMRRLDGFIARSKSPGVAHYCKLIEQDADELAKLEKFLTINVSEFFRDYMHFDILQNKILPELLQRSPRLNIWSAGCSNGAEAYSVAMILESLSHANHRILATDIDKTILSKAVAGNSYCHADIKNMPKTLLAKYFIFSQDSYKISDQIRKKVIFKQHDLTRDAFESGFDLIICRNTVIYFSDEAKKKLRKRFFDALKLNGVLFIGATETMTDAADIGFQRLYPCFYKKTDDVANELKAIATVPR
jgi:chemotaxis protein methyltransferase CheR